MYVLAAVQWDLFHAANSHANIRNQHRRGACCTVSRQKSQGLQDVVEPGPGPGVHVCFGFQVVKRVSRAFLVFDLHCNLKLDAECTTKKPCVILESEDTLLPKMTRAMIVVAFLAE